MSALSIRPWRSGKPGNSSIVTTDSEEIAALKGEVAALRSLLSAHIRATATDSARLADLMPRRIREEKFDDEHSARGYVATLRTMADELAVNARLGEVEQRLRHMIDDTLGIGRADGT